MPLFAHKGRTRTTSREKLLSARRPSLDSSRAGYTAALALLLFLFIGAMSVRQSTEQRNARLLIEAGVASLTDVDQVIVEYRPLLKQAAAASTQTAFTIPGYPLNIAFSRGEVTNATDAQFRQLLLERTSAYVYTDGLSAFDQNGKQSLSFFSAQGVLEQLVDWLSADIHDSARTASLILFLLVSVFALATAVRNRGFGRVRALGTAALVAGLAGLLLSTGVGWVLGNVWSGDPFSDDLHTLIGKLVDVPQRNYTVTAGLGLFLLVLGVVSSVVANQLPEDGLEVAEDAEY